MFGFLKKKLSELKEKIVGRPEEQEKRLEEEKPKSEKPKEVKPEKKEKKKPEKKEKKKPEKKTKAEEKKVKKKEKPKEEAKPKEVKTEKAKPKETKAEEEAKEAKVGVLSRIKKALSRKFKLSDAELDDYLWDIEIILLEADVAHEIAEEIVSKLRDKLSNVEFSSKEEVFDRIKQILRDILSDIIIEGEDITSIQKKPTIIMFIGPNGAGKTTTMAKLAKKLLDNNKTVIFAASDTFRAASIEQLEEHANRLGIKVVKHKYGADPAAVAYDAVKSAEAKGIDFVMIDTAGRQETNSNLIEELKKIKRVVNPDFVIYVDEGIAGNVIYDRLKAFREVGIDGVVLTKMDLDVKGGGVVTCASMGIPIVYFGVGQGYQDIKKFKKDEFLDELLG